MVLHPNRQEEHVMRTRYFCMVFAGLSVVFLLASSNAPAQHACFPAIGFFESQILPPDQCAAGLCTEGKLIGTPHGEYSFTANNLFPAEASLPNVFFYTGLSLVRTNKGVLYLIDTGALDFGNGNISALLTVVDGTGDFSDVTGFLHVFGASDLESGFAKGKFEGEICR